jgi:hypothetical protein
MIGTLKVKSPRTNFLSQDQQGGALLPLEFPDDFESILRLLLCRNQKHLKREIYLTTNTWADMLLKVPGKEIGLSRERAKNHCILRHSDIFVRSAYRYFLKHCPKPRNVNDMQQALGRISWIGQKRATTGWILHTPGSIDDRAQEL